MKRFWNWIRNEAGGRVLRLEGPIDEESFWGDEVTPKAFREELEADSGDGRRLRRKGGRFFLVVRKVSEGFRGARYRGGGGAAAYFGTQGFGSAARLGATEARSVGRFRPLVRAGGILKLCT